MNVLKAAALGMLMMSLAACPDRPREPMVNPATEPLVTDPVLEPADPDLPPPDAEVATLEPVGAATASGQVYTAARDVSTEIWVTVGNAPPSESLGVRVHIGTCEEPGEEIARITAIRTDGARQGQTRTDVGHAPTRLMDGNHVVAVSALGTQPTRDPPIACATIASLGIVPVPATTGS